VLKLKYILNDKNVKAFFIIVDCVPNYGNYLPNPYGSSRNSVARPKEYSEVV